MCKKASQKLSALPQISAFIDLNKRQSLIQSMIKSQFSYCPFTKSSSAAGRSRCRLGNRRTCLQGTFRHITKSSSAAGSTSRWLRNRSTCIQGAFRHITKSPSAAVCTRRRLGNIVIAP